jgi:2-dehydro-3-deoxyphosphogluconate aldolase/(4S)-4-hydroxy-2-oxoglutarate aldolase
MMNTETAYGYIKRCGLVAVMRGDFPAERALEIARVLVAEGINVFEMTMNSDGAIEAMQTIKHEFGEDVASGMGTVLDVQAATRALEAEPDFVVSPSFNPGVVKAAQAVDVLVAPGVITPTEIVDAWATGVKLLKIFPIGSLGLDYFKSIRAPLDHINMMCNGGTNDVTVREFMQAGAVACGMAGWLVGDGRMSQDTIRHRARTLRQIVDGVRSGEPNRVSV